MQSFSAYLIYLLFRLSVGLISIIPFAILYALSDLLAFIFIHLIKYRYKVIRTNLVQSFPELSEREIEKLHIHFLHHLADIFLEGIKGFSMSKETLLTRYQVKNPEIFSTHSIQGKSILLAGSHYNNWEWGVLIFNQALPLQVSGIYQIVKNPYIQQYLMKRRARWGMNLISVQNAIQTIISYPKQHAVMILSDQSPSNIKSAIWLDFLNQDTPCLHGLGVMAIKTGFPIYYYEVIKVKRGYYEIQINTLVADPSKETVESITQLYYKVLEATIKKAPQYWLWSHRRWKRQREGAVEV